MKRYKWQQDRDVQHAEARIDLVNAMEDYPKHVVHFVLLDYLRRDAYAKSTDEFEQRNK